VKFRGCVLGRTQRRKDAKVFGVRRWGCLGFSGVVGKARLRFLQIVYNIFTLNGTIGILMIQGPTMNKLTTIFAATLLLAASAFSQTMESIPFRVQLNAQNEVPALTLNASGFGTIWLHVNKNAAGRVVSGNVEFITRYTFPTPITFTGMHIHRGNAGTNGPVLIDTGITAANNFVDETGSTGITRSAAVMAGSANVEVLEQIIANPGGFYLNLHTTANPGGAIRGQLMPAKRIVFGSMLSPENEVPAVTSNARGVGFLSMLVSNINNRIMSAEVTFDINYTGFAEGTQFTGMHIHLGNAGANGPVTIGTVLSRAQNVFAGANGAGNLKYVVDADVANANTYNTVAIILSNPAAAYWNLHTVANAGGEIRAQLRSTDEVSFSLDMSPANEVPALTTTNKANALVVANVLRRPEGVAMAGYGFFSVNYEFAGATTFTGLHIHQGLAGANGPVSLDSGITAARNVMSATGFGNLNRQLFASSEAQVNTLNTLLNAPDGAYLNLHTTVNPGGAVRAQMAAANTALPVVQNVISGVYDPALKTQGQGAVMAIFGTNLSRMPGTLDGSLAPRAPETLNGTSVQLQGRAAPIIQVSPGIIMAQVPYETEAGEREVVVRNVNGASTPYRVTVGAVAPGIFFDQVNTEGYRLVAFDAASFNQITQQTPAASGMVLGIFGTGFGQSTPALPTGAIAPETPNAAIAGVTVTVGGRAAGQVLASPVAGFIGFTQVIFQVPAGLSGAQPVEVEVRGVKSNRTILYLR
jgi:uncharacterized protein (TIGR03437 family)